MTELQEVFEKAGIPSQPYKKGPLGSGTFFLSLNPKRDNVRYWMPKENTNIENIRFSNKHRQVTFSVVEPRRVIEREVEMSNWRGYGSNFQDYELRNNFGINLPATAKYSVVSSKKKDVKRDINPYDYGDRYDLYDVKIKAVVPKSTQHFLLGFDEQNLFVALLPKAAKSVEDAHKILRPDGATPSTPRQGEYFFLPADIDEEILDRKYENRVKKGVGHNWFSNDIATLTRISDGRDGMNHRASQVVHDKNKTYAKGHIFDTTGRHESLSLPKWKRVVRNNELVVAGNSANWD